MRERLRLREKDLRLEFERSMMGMGLNDVYVSNMDGIEEVEERHDRTDDRVRFQGVGHVDSSRGDVPRRFSILERNSVADDNSVVDPPIAIPEPSGTFGGKKRRVVRRVVPKPAVGAASRNTNGISMA